MRKFFLILAASLMTTGVFAEGYQVNNMSAKQTGMGHVGTAMQLNSESVFFNPAATAFQKSKFDISVGFTGVLSSVRYRALPTAENNYTIGDAQKSDNGLSTPLHMYFNYKPTERLALGLGFYTPDGSSMKWNDNWSGAHLIQEINLAAFTVQPTLSYKITDRFSIGAGLTVTWGNFDLSRSMLRVGIANQKFQQIPGLVQGLIATGKIPAAMAGPLQAKANYMANYFKDNLTDAPIVSTKMAGDADVAVGINAGFLWEINDEWSVGMTWRSRVNMKVARGNAQMLYGSEEAKQILGELNGLAPTLGGMLGTQLPYLLPPLDEGTFKAELPLPTSVTWGVSFRPTPKWEFAVDLQWVGWSAYDRLEVTFNEPELHIKPIVSVKNYSNTLAFRFGGEYRATDFITARMGMYVDESPVNSNYLNPETPSMTKVSYTAGLSMRPTKKMSIDMSYCYVSTADPERTGQYPVYNYMSGKLEEAFSGNYALHAHVFSVGLNFAF